MFIFSIVFQSSRVQFHFQVTENRMYHIQPDFLQCPQFVARVNMQTLKSKELN